MDANYWQTIPTIYYEYVGKDQEEQEPQVQEEAHDEDQAEQLPFYVGEDHQLAEENEGHVNVFWPEENPAEEGHDHANAFWPPEDPAIEVGVDWQPYNQMKQVDVGWYPNNLPDEELQNQIEEEDQRQEREDFTDTNGYCNLCKDTFKSFTGVLNHQNRTHKESKIECPNCGRRFGSNSDMWKHADKRHHLKLR